MAFYIIMLLMLLLLVINRLNITDKGYQFMWSPCKGYYCKDYYNSIDCAVSRIEYQFLYPSYPFRYASSPPVIVVGIGNLCGY